MTENFWLFCGLWCGLGNAIHLRSRLRKHVALGTFAQDEVNAFLKGLVLWMLVPCLVLWGLQWSVGPESTPLFLAWPSPQRHLALALQVFVWASLLYWIFLRDGAETLSTYYGAGSRAPAFIHSPIVFKLGALAAAVGGGTALLAKHV